MKKWQIKEQDSAAAASLAQSAGINDFAARLLINRGITTREAAELFFSGSELTPPSDMTDMEKAAGIISDAIQNGDKITVYGDYDCDGVTATVILYGYLEAIGAQADWYIPDREEGYGLNNAAVDKLADSGTKLIITVDNGISAISEAKYIKEKGMGLIITDHHQVPEELPDALAIVNPHRSDDYCTCKELAGCGVALKLVMALEGDTESVLEQWSDLAAIGTIGDIVPLTGENRILVRRGLENLLYTENIGLHNLLGQCGIVDCDRIPASTVAFAVCPRINAAGRFAHPKEAAELFLNESSVMAPVMAERLTLLNSQRQQEEKRIIEEIGQLTENDPLILKKRIIVLCGKGWSHGVIGIVAAKLLNKYGKPVIIITEEGGESRGSARSIEGFSLYNMLTRLSHLLIKFGGHTKAAGFSIETSRTKEFSEAVNEYAARLCPEMPSDFFTAEMRLSVKDLTEENIENLQYFEPFGEANPVPVFAMESCTVKSLRSLKEGKYLSFNVDFQGSEFKVLNFRSTYNDFPFKAGDKADLLVTADINEYNGKRKISLKLTDIRRSGFAQDRYFAAKSFYEKLSLDEEVSPSMAKRVIPDKSVQRAVYDIAKCTSSLSAAADMAGEKGINYCMFRVTMDAFENTGLVKLNAASDSYRLLEPKGKVDLDNCPYLQHIRARLAAGCV